MKKEKLSNADFWYLALKKIIENNNKEKNLNNKSNTRNLNNESNTRI